MMMPPNGQPHDLSGLFGPSAEHILNDLLGPNAGQFILPASGLICPECGYEPRRLPDGQPSDAIQFKVDDRTTPFYHLACVQKALIQRDAEYIAEHVGQLEKNLKEVDGGNSSPA